MQISGGVLRFISLKFKICPTIIISFLVLLCTHLWFDLFTLETRKVWTAELRPKSTLGFEIGSPKNYIETFP
jgi:hypothetical protein